jgi:hypothetical protein
MSPSITPTLTNTPVRGASLPYDEYEAEAASSNGTVLGPSRSVGNVASEASGRQAVQLSNVGDYVSFAPTLNAANSIVVRYCIPDAAAGGGISATISLYVNGSFVQKLNLTSKYSWDYNGWSYPYNQNPATGSPHHFFDEVHALLGSSIPAGSTVTLQKDAGDTASYYDIDLIDLENVGPPISQPAGSYSVMSYGATGDGVTDDTAAIASCISAASGAGKVVWIPSGTYALSSYLTVTAVAIQGAGMWYTTLHQKSDVDVFRTSIGAASFFIGDMLLQGEVINRNDAISDNGIDGSGGTGSTVNNVWIEHTKVGWWVGSGASVTNNLTISNCRIRDTYADGININVGTSNSTITQCNVRNTGDDQLASWSQNGSGSTNTSNVFSYNTLQIPWRANCIGIYGGKSNSAQNNLCSDTVDYAGIMVAQQFSSKAFSGTTSLLHNTLLRCGGFFNGSQYGALSFDSIDAAMAGFSVQDMSILNATYAGLQFAGSHAINTTTISVMNVSSPGTYGIVVSSAVTGGASIDTTVVTSPVFGGLSNPGSFVITRGSGNSGW